MRPSSYVVALLLSLCLIPAGAAGAGKTVGVPTAPIQMEVFSDFQCSHCAAFFEQTLRALENDYARPGKVYVIHREFPLNGNPLSREAAFLATAAARIGKYEQVAGALFSRQQVWSANGKVEETALSVLSAGDAAKVRALAKDPSVVAEVDRDVALGQKIPIRATPTIILTHKLRQYPLTGSVSYPLLRRFLDELLSK